MRRTGAPRRRTAPARPRERSCVATRVALGVLLVARTGGAQPIVAHTDTAAPPLTLAQALERARASRPQVAAAAAGVERARGAARLGALVPNPLVGGQRDARTPTRQATITQPLAWLLRRGADAAAGRAGVVRAAADSAQLLADLGRDVRRAFYGALAGDERLRLAAEQARYADSLVALADRRVAAGDLSALERDQVAQEAARARLAAWQAREQARVARVELARAVAWTGPAEGPGAPRPAGALAEALDTPDVVGDASAGAGSAAEVAALPTLRAALADSAAAAARYRAARLAQLPLPAVVAGAEWGASATADAGARVAAHTTPIVGLSVALPFWNQGREAAAEARGAAAEGAARAGEARLTVTAQLAAARVRAAETAARARFARDSLAPEAARIRTGAVRLYEAGRTGLLPVLDALRVERDVAGTLVQALLAFQEARADLFALLGRQP